MGPTRRVRPLEPAPIVCHPHLQRPVFDAHKHVQWTSSWAWAERDVLALYHRLARGEEPITLDALAARLSPQGRIMARALAARAERRGYTAAQEAMRALAAAPEPHTPYAGKTALVTGASPGSIAFAVCERLLQGGARIRTAPHRPARGGMIACTPCRSATVCPHALPPGHTAGRFAHFGVSRRRPARMLAPLRVSTTCAAKNRRERCARLQYSDRAFCIIDALAKNSAP